MAMIIIRSPADISKAKLPTHLAQYIEKLLTSIIEALEHYDPEDDGHIVLITPKDVDSNLCERIGRGWSESVFEAISYNKEYNCYHTVIMQNNQFAVSIVIPCEAWLDPAIRERISREMI
jgi:hypothetical protein